MNTNKKYSDYLNQVREVKEYATKQGLRKELVDSIEIHPTINMAKINHRFLNVPLTDLSQKVYRPSKEDMEKGGEEIFILYPHLKVDGIKTYADLYNYQYEVKEKSVEKYIQKEDWAKVIIRMETPQQFDWFFNNSDRITDDKEFYEILREIYDHNDFPLCCLGHRCVGDLIDLIESRGNPSLMMDEKELKMFNKLDGVLTIYRGVNIKKGYEPFLDAENIGISWSIDKKSAQRFSFRNLWGRTPYLLETKIKKEDVFGYFISRKEKEILIDPFDLDYPIKVEELDKGLSKSLFDNEYQESKVRTEIKILSKEQSILESS